ncbi:ribonuclease H-like YkuK family protein [Patescibacteria group bacterium]|nr:ribonuclease H-like YkuK family protein [Patescibacteria group bacterium]
MRETFKEEQISTEVFTSQTHGQVDLHRMVDLIRVYVDEDLEKEYSLVIGTDSHERNESGNGKNQLTIVTAVTIHRDHVGGIYFYKKKNGDNLSKEASRRSRIRNKIYQETTESLRFASYFVPLLQERLNGQFPRLEIHIDVGERGETRDMIKEVVGMVTGSGYQARIKPDSFGASNVADKHT